MKKNYQSPKGCKKTPWNAESPALSLMQVIKLPTISATNSPIVSKKYFSNTEEKNIFKTEKSNNNSTLSLLASKTLENKFLLNRTDSFKEKTIEIPNEQDTKNIKDNKKTKSFKEIKEFYDVKDLKNTNKTKISKETEEFKIIEEDDEINFIKLIETIPKNKETKDFDTNEVQISDRDLKETRKIEYLKKLLIEKV